MTAQWDEVNEVDDVEQIWEQVKEALGDNSRELGWERRNQKRNAGIIRLKL